VRRYVGFRLASIVVLILAAWNILIYGVVMASRTQAQYIATERAARAVISSPGFFFAFNLTLLVGMFALYATRRTEYVYLRTYVYAMVLAALVGEVLHFALPLP
jgi:hypothetical protein